MQEWAPRINKLESNERDQLAFCKSLIREDRLDEALVELKNVLKANPKSYQAIVAIGRIYERQGNSDQAMSFFSRAMKLDPMQADAPLRAGQLCLIKNNGDEARRYFQQALNLDPKSYRAHVGLAQQRFLEDDLDGAASHVEEGLRLAPQHVQGRLLSARIHQKSGRTDMAIGELRSLLTMRPGHSNAAIHLARLYAGQEKHDEATKVLEAAAQATPDDTRILGMLGRAAMKKQDYATAERVYRTAIDLKPDRHTPNLRLVEALIPQGKSDEAREILEKLPRNRRFATLVQKSYGDIHLHDGQFKEAAESYRAVMLGLPGGDDIVAGIESSIGDGDWQALAGRLQSEAETMIRAAMRSHREQNPRRRGKRAENSGNDVEEDAAFD